MLYADLRAKFLRRLNRRDCTNTLADDFLQDAVQRIQRVMRVPISEQSVEITVDSTSYFDNGFMSIPSDFLLIRELTVNDRYGLVKKPLSFVKELAAASNGTPSYYARQGGGFVLAPAPDAGTVVRLDYYSEFPDINQTPDVETILLKIAPDLVLYGALSYAADQWNDKRAQLFESRFTQILSDLQSQGDADELAGSSAVVQAHWYPSDD